MSQALPAVKEVSGRIKLGQDCTERLPTVHILWGFRGIESSDIGGGMTQATVSMQARSANALGMCG